MLNLNCVTDTVSIITSDGRNFVVSIVHHGNTVSFSSVEKCFQSCENVQCSTKMYILCVYTLAYVGWFFSGDTERFWPDNQPDIGWKPWACIQHKPRCGASCAGAPYY